MTRTIFSNILTVGLLVAIGGCEQNSNQPDTQLRAELEQLQNELGRLEFRVYQLEHPEEKEAAQTLDETTDEQINELSGD